MSNEKSNERPNDVAETVDHYTATTIPVHVEIDVKQTVLHLEEAERILREADSIALGPCACREQKRNCNAPVETCLALNQKEEDLAKESRGFKPITVERALETLRASHKAGLVHLAYRKPGNEITEFCSCCSCCCWFLDALKRFDYHDAIVEASHVAEHDVERCVACGACVERCPFDTWSPAQNGGKPSLDVEKCFGCGVCVSGCPAGAISFIPRVATPS